MSALEERIKAEELAKAKECECAGCRNRATHTWSGHPTCDDCGSPGRDKVPRSAMPNLITSLNNKQ
jgi:hypothetical protein